MQNEILSILSEINACYSDNIREFKRTVKHIPIIKVVKKYKYIFKQYRILKREFDMYSIKKITVKFELIPHLLSFCSIIFFIGGIIRAFVIAYKFTFQVDVVYTIGDYIASAISALTIPTISVTFFFFLNSITSIEDSKLSNAGKRREYTKSNRDFNIFVALLISLSILFYFLDNSFWISLSQILVFFIVVRFVAWIVGRYIANNKKFLIGSLYTLFFIFVISTSSIIYSDNIIEGKNNEIYTISLNSNSELIENVNIIVRTSSFSVLWNTETDTTRIIDNSNVFEIIPQFY